MRIIQPVITSRKNDMVVTTASLKERKYREEQGLFLAEGEKLVQEAARAHLPVERLLVAKSHREDILPLVDRFFCAPQYAELPVYILADECFEKVSTEKAPQGVLAVIKYLDFFQRSIIIYNDSSFLREQRILLLYDIQDPGNLGAIVRSAVAFGIDTVIMSDGCADLYNAKVLRASMGCLFRLRVCITPNYPATIRQLRSAGRHIFAAELRPHAVSLHDAILAPTDCFLIGNEGHGIPKELSALCDQSVYIPISQNAESLNAAVAASVLLWEQSKR